MTDSEKFVRDLVRDIKRHRLNCKHIALMPDGNDHEEGYYFGVRLTSENVLWNFTLIPCNCL